MTDYPTTATGTEPSETASAAASSEEHIAHLERLLSDAEAELRELRAELDEARRQRIVEATNNLPDDISALEGRWSDLRTFLRALIHSDESPAAAEAAPASPASSAATSSEAAE